MYNGWCMGRGTFTKIALVVDNEAELRALSKRLREASITHKLLEESRLDAGEIARLRDVVDRKAAESSPSSSPAAAEASQTKS